RVIENVLLNAGLGEAAATTGRGAGAAGRYAGDGADGAECTTVVLFVTVWVSLPRPPEPSA
ncbi:hypothetical protein, partial [Corynebacterium striatum]